MRRTIETRSVTINITRTEVTTEQTEYGERKSARSIPDGTATGTVAMTIDIDAMFRMLGARALANRNGKARLASGAIEFVVDRKSVKRAKP